MVLIHALLAQRIDRDLICTDLEYLKAKLSAFLLLLYRIADEFLRECEFTNTLLGTILPDSP